MSLDLARWGNDLQVAVVGAGGIGSALTEHLLVCPQVARVHLLCRHPSRCSLHHTKLTLGQLDLNDPASIESAFTAFSDTPLHWVLVASGLLHSSSAQPEKQLSALHSDAFQQLMQVNALGPLLVAQAALPKLTRQRPTLFAALSARVGSIGDNHLGGWYSYRASKAALNMLLRCLAIEQHRRLPQLTVLGLHPGTVDTPLSAPFQSRVPARQLFSPAQSAKHLLQVLSQATPEQSGQILAWDGQPIPP